MSERRWFFLSTRRAQHRTLIAGGCAVALVASLLGTAGVEPVGAHISGTTDDIISINGSLPSGVQECGTTPGVDNTANCLSSPRASHQIFAFDEKQNYVLPSNLTVDFGPQSSNWASGTTYSTEAQILGHSYSLLAGDTVSSHLLHTDLPYSDPAASPSQSSGSVFFSVIPQIYGLIFTDARLGATDALGAPGVTYPTVDTNRGWEFDCVGTSVFTGIACSPAYNAFVDSFEIGPTGELSVLESVTTGMDQTRVLTNVPDPPTVTCPGPVTAAAGQVAHASGGTFSDNDSFPTVTLTADRGAVSQVGTGRSGTWSWDLDTSLSLPSGPITVTATDDQGQTGSCSFNLTVTNVTTQTVPAGGTMTIGGTKVTPATPTIAKLKLPKKVPAATVSQAAFAQATPIDEAVNPSFLHAFTSVTGPSSSVSMALIDSAADPDCLEGETNVCVGQLVGVDPGPGHVSKSKPIKLTITWLKDPRKDSRTSTLWVTKLRPGTNIRVPTARVPTCQKVGKDFVNTPCLSKASFPGGNYRALVMLLSGDPKFGRR